MKEINFFTEYHGQEREQNTTLFNGLIIATIAVILVTYLGSMLRITMLNHEIESLQAELNLPGNQEKLAISQDVNQKLNVLNILDTALAEVNQGVSGRDVVSVLLLQKLSSTLPSEVSFQSLNITNGNIMIQAVSTSRSAIAEVEHHLAELDVITDVYISGIAEVGGVVGQYTFDVRCVLIEGGQ